MEICKAIYDGPGKIKFLAPIAGSLDINDIIEQDKAYGKMHPMNGEYFTYRIENTLDIEITGKRLQKAYQKGWRRWTKRINFVIKKAKQGEPADFRVIFRTPETDERGEMDYYTIGYHYFPINNISSPYRGLCVVNSKFIFTTHGEPISMHEIDPVNYPEDTTNEGMTVDIDQFFGHEDGHGIGLPHDPQMGNTMSPSYSFMAEFLSERDVFRGIKKYGMAKLKVSAIVRWWRRMRKKSDSY